MNLEQLVILPSLMVRGLTELSMALPYLTRSVLEPSRFRSTMGGYPEYGALSPISLAARLSQELSLQQPF